MSVKHKSMVDFVGEGIGESEGEGILDIHVVALWAGLGHVERALMLHI